MLLNDIGDLLSSGGITVTTYLGVIAPLPDTALAVYETGGSPPAHVMGNAAGQAVAEYPRIQVVSRSADYETARWNSHLAYRLLDGLPTRTINGTRYLWATAVQPPFLMGRDAQERVLVAFNVDITKQPSTSTST